MMLRDPVMPVDATAVISAPRSVIDGIRIPSRPWSLSIPPATESMGTFSDLEMLNSTSLAEAACPTFR